MTTVDKTIKTLTWVVISAAITAAAGFITNHPNLFNPIVVAAVNVLLVAGKNFFDREVPNI